jgi:hypothetical protein
VLTCYLPRRPDMHRQTRAQVRDQTVLPVRYQTRRPTREARTMDRGEAATFADVHESLAGPARNSS